MLRLYVLEWIAHIRGMAGIQEFNVQSLRLHMVYELSKLICVIPRDYKSFTDTRALESNGDASNCRRTSAIMSSPFNFSRETLR